MALAHPSEVIYRNYGQGVARCFSCSSNGSSLTLVPLEDSQCSISFQFPDVLTIDGQAYDQACISRWLQQHSTSPNTGARLAQTALMPLEWLKIMLEAYMNSRPEVSNAFDAIRSLQQVQTAHVRIVEEMSNVAKELEEEKIALQAVVAEHESKMRALEQAHDRIVSEMLAVSKDLEEEKGELRDAVVEQAAKVRVLEQARFVLLEQNAAIIHHAQEQKQLIAKQEARIRELEQDNIQIHKDKAVLSQQSDAVIQGMQKQKAELCAACAEEKGELQVALAEQAAEIHTLQNAMQMFNYFANCPIGIVRIQSFVRGYLDRQRVQIMIHKNKKKEQRVEQQRQQRDQRRKDKASKKQQREQLKQDKASRRMEEARIEWMRIAPSLRDVPTPAKASVIGPYVCKPQRLGKYDYRKAARRDDIEGYLDIGIPLTINYN